MELTGLSAAEAEARRRAGQINLPPRPSTKTVGQIICGNLFTYFNLVFAVLAVALASVGSYTNMAFLGVVVCNTVIGIVQQLRSKRTIDKLTLVTAHRVRCLRDGVWCDLLSGELVRDDVVSFAAGEQICADAVVLSGTAQANEALLTGEADPVPKAAGDTLQSGSFLMSGECVARLTHVGAESYASRLTAAAQANGHAVPRGEMMRSLNKLIHWIGIAIVPLGTVMLVKQHWLLEMPLRDTMEGTVAALVGMIPEGLYLLTTIALAAGTLRLARGGVLVQDMNCIETLARVDVLCVDKTGTITEPAMQAGEPELLNGTREEVHTILRNFCARMSADNDTARALLARFGGMGTWRCTGTVAFNTAYKYTAAAFAEQGTYLIGAPDRLAGPRSSELQPRLERYRAAGRRVLLLVRYHGGLPQPPAQPDSDRMEFLALLPVENPVRTAAPDTFAWFERQGVAVKVISGDDAPTVSAVAAQAGIRGAEQWVDASELDTDEKLERAARTAAVFGRVTPEQKRKLVAALQRQGHTVAMTGDGVNDVLALKDADCGIAMASGAQAASQIARLVLLDSDFSALPAVVDEGRRVINNIQRSASLFLVKNVFSFLFSILTLFFAVPYPLQPVQLTVVSALTIGIPSFFLALEPNHDRVRGKFLPNVLRAAAPGGLTNVVLALAAQAGAELLELPHAELSTLVTLLLFATGLTVLFGVCRPFTLRRRLLWGTMAAAGVFLLPAMSSVLELTIPGGPGMVLLVCLLALVIPCVAGFTRLVDHFVKK